MKKIKEIRKVTCKETRDRFMPIYEGVGLWVADMADGTCFYTSKGGTGILGTDTKIDGWTDIANIFDFQTIDVPGGVQSEEQFREIVEREAVIDKVA